MRLKSKTSFLLKITLCIALALSTFGAVMSFVGDKLTAKAETVEYQDILAIENRSWGAASDEYYFGGYTIGASTANNAHWLNTDASVNGCWYHGNNALIAANNGVDILKYIYVNDTSAREAITANVNSSNQMVGSTGWLTNPAASPVYVETTNGSGLIIKILKAYAGENYTLTFKAGFRLLRNDGNVICLSDDVVYNCVGNVPTRVNKSTVTFNDENGNPYTTKRVINGTAIGKLPAAPARDGYVGFWTIDGAPIDENTIITSSKTAKATYGIEYQDFIGIEDRTSWASGGHADIVTFGLMDNGAYFKSSVSGCWYTGNDGIIATNNSVDILEYIYLNGTSARALLNANTEGKTTANTGSWLSNPAAWPIAFETGADVWIRIDKTAFESGNFTFTIKEGFSLLRSDGERVYVSNDVTYTYENGVLGAKFVDKKYKLSFEGVDTTTVLRDGEPIGELPAVPERAGCDGAWVIDGVVITADSVYNYGADKTAKALYSKDITETIGFGDWGVPETESDIRYLWIRNNNAEIATAYPNSYWNDHEDNKNSNYGVDIMQYILIDGVSARDIINANAAGTTSYKAASTFPLSMGGCYAPICIETAGDGIRFKVMVDYKTSFRVTFKAGFTLVNTDGERLYVAEDVTYRIGASAGDIEKVTEPVEPEVPTVEEIDITDTIGLGDWGVPETESDIRYLWIRNNGADIFTSYANACWNDHAENKDSNYGVDLMEYVLIDGESIRTIVNRNASGETSYKGTTSPLNYGNAFAPIAFETASSRGIRFKVMVAYKTTFKVTFKAGFTVVTSDGKKLYTTEDVTYRVGVDMNDIVKVQDYTLSFEGLGDTLTVSGGDPIGELPAVPARDGLEGVWTIDGVEINADTVYNYGANKTAVALYKKDVTDTLNIEFAYSNTTDSKFKIFLTPVSELSSNGWWNISGDRLTAANKGVDIMDYIYINDQSVRALSDDNRTNNTYPVGDATGWFTNSDQCRPVFVETNSEGIWVNVLHSFSSENYVLTIKAGFAILCADGNLAVVKKDISFSCVNGSVTQMKEYTLSFEGLDETLTVVSGAEIGTLPKAPVEDGCEGVWTIDGVEINENTIYNYSGNKTAVPSYKVDISMYLALEDRSSWMADAGEFSFAVLDNRDGNVTKDGNGNAVKYLNSNNAGCWYHGNDAIIAANSGIDIMQYIYINDKSARELIIANVNGANLVNGCGCWLSNPAASPVCVETSTNSGIMIKVLQSFVGNYFEITFKAGFSIMNDQNVRVYLTKDVTYKYIVTSEGTTFAKGELTDDDLDMLNGQEIELIVNGESYLVKKTARLTLPKIENIVVGEEGLTQVFVGWTTDPTGLSTLYPAGYKLEPSSAMTLHAVWIGFEMEEGAAVRLNKENPGIRFTVHVDSSGYNAGVTLGLISDIGTIICPATYLVNGRELTHELGEGYFLASSADKSKFVAETTGFKYATAFVNIPEKDFSRVYAARGYLKVEFTTGTGYVYTDYNAEDNARSIYEVATAAYNDEKNPHYKTNEIILNYLNKVLDITWDDNYNFSANSEALGNSEITDITRDGYTITVNYTGDVKSVLINGVRLAETGRADVAIGNLLYSFSDLTFVTGGVQFTLGAANNTGDKESDELLHFVSSDEELDFFLNDFFKRHTGVIEDGESLKVNSVTAGVDAEEFFNQEWLSMTQYWHNSFEGYVNEKGDVQNRLEGMNNRLRNVPIDDYGYVWSANDRVRDPKTDVSIGEQKMGWPFPNNDTVGTAHWEFNSSNVDSWSSNISASASGGLYGKSLSNQSQNVTFTSKSFSGLTSKKVYTLYAPLLEFEVRIADASSIEDIYVWFTTNSSTSFSEDKKLSVKTHAFLNYNIGACTGEYNHILYLPMYANTAWGESTSTYMKQLKIEIVLKSGATLSGYVGLNYVRPTLDTRMSNNNSIYISSLRTAYDYTGDLEFLTEQITRARKAYNFLMQMYDSNRKLKRESYLVGHGGDKEDTNWLGNATNESIANSISQGYWDIMYMPEYDFQSNVYFQKALVDMAYLEQVLFDNGITVDKAEATVKTATREGVYGSSEYPASIDDMKDTANANLTAIQANVEESKTSGGFWDATDGRFVAGYGYNPDKKANVVYDYGYVAWNLEAIYYGIATDEQAKAIMNWLASEKDLYKYVFAPLSITKTGDADALNGEYAAQGDKWINCQFGGAILYTSFYDIMARLEVTGADDAFARLQAIQAWYKEVYDYYVANGSNPYDFYRYYYDNKGIQCQGMGTAGAVGLDREFLESALPLASVAYGFFGIDSVDGKTMSITPELPADLDYWKMENLAFNKVKYDLKIYGNAIQLSNVRGNVAGLNITVALNYAEGQHVYVNGVEVTDFVVENGKAIVTVAFGATVVEVK